MDLDLEVHSENVDSKPVSSSPNTQSDASTDGDASLIQSGNSLPTEQAKSVSMESFEPKSKKRRKQSKPLKCENVISNEMEMPLDEEIDKVDQQVFEVKEDVEKSKSEPKMTEETKASEPEENAITETVNNTDALSQKNILSQMTGMLFNNAFHGADLLNQMVSQGKGMGLLDANSSDSNEGLLRNLDPKTMFSGLYPQMPPLLPLNSNDMVGELSKLSSVFSQLAELPAQFTPTSTSITGSNRSFITSNGVRVFNPEAYCELCEKEFCNKYFLKTHKANKHGVCSIDNGNNPFRALYKTTNHISSIPPSGISQSSENGSQGPSDAYCNICQKSFCNKYFLKKHRLNIHGIIENGSTESSPSMPSSIHVPVISTLALSRLQTGEVKSENSVDFPMNDESKYVNTSLANIQNTMNGSPMSALLNFNGFNSATVNKPKADTPAKGESFICDLCNIEFCDKHYLDSHKQNKHKGSVLSSGITLESTSFNKVQNNEENNITQVVKVENVEDCNDDVEEFKDQMCAPCMKNFTTADAFQSHMLEVHGAALKVEDDSKKTSTNVDQNSITSPQGSPLCQMNLPNNECNDNTTDSNFVYCSLCLKKFKDKSALLTHFDIQHKLNNSSDQANLKSQVSIFKCDVCPERFSDKNKLLSHRLNVHGIISTFSEDCIDVVDAATDVMSEIEKELLYIIPDKFKGALFQKCCRICNKEIRNNYLMKSHMLDAHSLDIEMLLADPSISIRSGVTCDMCDKIITNKCFLKIHKMGIHGLTREMNKHGVLQPFDSIETSDKKTSPPSLNHAINVNHIDFTKSTSPENNNIIDNAFPCDICSQKFPSKLLLKVHLVNKHVNNGEPQITNLRELIGLSGGNPEVLGLSPSSLPKQNGNSKEHNANETGCSCCSFINVDKLPGKYASRGEEKMLMCHLCNYSYSMGEYCQHHTTHRNVLASELRLKNPHDILYRNFISNNKEGEFGTRKSKPRKIKRFRCSKCDKPFRTRNKCLHHIQVVHKNKKGSINTNDRYIESSPKKSINAIKPDSKVNLNVQTLNDCSNAYSKNLEMENCIDNSDYQPSAPMPVPYVLPKNARKDVIMQPFHLSEPTSNELSKPDIFVPSLVYLPVSQKVSEPLTVAFTLTPA